MIGRAILILSIIYCCKSETDDANLVENDLLGVEATHDVKLGKDIVFTTNMKPHMRKRAKKDEEKYAGEPDWSYSSYPEEVKTHIMQFKKNMSECLKEVQTNDKRIVKPLSPKTESPVHAECLIACVLKRNGVIVNGKIRKDNLITLVGRFYAKDTKLMKKLEKNVDRCIELSIKYRDDECRLASFLNDCTNDLMISNKNKIAVNY